LNKLYVTLKEPHLNYPNGVVGGSPGFSAEGIPYAPDFYSGSANENGDENGLRVPDKYSFPVLVAVLVNR
jgi:hypothetical protein